MNEDIIRMAREAGLHSAVLLHLYDGKEAALTDSECDELRRLERFAALVRADEREACAKVCESLDETDMRSRYDYRRGVLDCVDAIRARGSKP